MIFKVLQKTIEYKGCPIVIRLADETFEYITCIDNQIYSAFVIAKKSLLQKALFRDYTEEQLKNITIYMLNMAQTTIDTVINGKQPEVEPKTE